MLAAEWSDRLVSASHQIGVGALPSLSTRFWRFSVMAERRGGREPAGQVHQHDVIDATNGACPLLGSVTSSVGGLV
jgi:hypothetical protein